MLLHTHRATNKTVNYYPSCLLNRPPRKGVSASKGLSKKNCRSCPQPFRGLGSIVGSGAYSVRQDFRLVLIVPPQLRRMDMKTTSFVVLTILTLATLMGCGGAPFTTGAELTLNPDAQADQVGQMGNQPVADDGQAPDAGPGKTDSGANVDPPKSDSGDSGTALEPDSGDSGAVAENTDAGKDSAPQADAETPDAGSNTSPDSGINPTPDSGTTPPDSGTTCSNECTANQTTCGSGGVQTCQTQANGCTQWVTTSTCGANQTCMVSAGGPSCTCNASECSEVGTVCQDAQTVATCAKDANGCFYAASTSTCQGQSTCSGTAPNAACSKTCTDSCTPGQTTCGTVKSLQTCTLGSNGCYSYGPAVACGQNQECSGQAGAAACTCFVSSYCGPNGTTTGNVCDGTLGYRTCSTDAQGCVYVSHTTGCGTYEQCGGAAGSATCTCKPNQCNNTLGNICWSNQEMITCSKDPQSGCIYVSNTKGCVTSCTYQNNMATCI
jgi:hypothetical protein